MRASVILKLKTSKELPKAIHFSSYSLKFQPFEEEWGQERVRSRPSEMTNLSFKYANQNQIFNIFKERPTLSHLF